MARMASGPEEPPARREGWPLCRPLWLRVFHPCNPWSILARVALRLDRTSLMRKVNLNDIAEEERKSPKGKFHKFVKDISIALGREKESLDLAKRHPFDLALVRIPKSKSYCPYHGHGAETE